MKWEQDRGKCLLAFLPLQLTKPKIEMMCYCFALVLLVQMQSTSNNFQLKQLDSYVKSWQRGKKTSEGEKKPRNTGAIERKKTTTKSANLLSHHPLHSYLSTHSHFISNLMFSMLVTVAKC